MLIKRLASIASLSNQFCTYRTFTKTSSVLRKFNPSISRFYTVQHSSRMNVSSIVSVLESIASSSTAEDWDNVGLLVQPSNDTNSIEHIFLTIDLTEAVLDEAVQSTEPVGMIISYHPPIFRPFKRLTQSTAKERIIIKAIESRIAIYSPHTSHDNMWGGINDWILKAFNKGTVTPLSTNQHIDVCPMELNISGFPDSKSYDELISQLSLTINTVEYIPAGQVLKCLVNKSSLNELLPKLLEKFPNYKLTVAPSPKVLTPGPGRLLTFYEPTSLNGLVSQIKSHLGLTHIRLAKPHGWDSETLVSSVAVCVGSGSSVLKGVRADVYLTGEMSHHDILEANSCGTAVLLCEHTNTERGFLQVFKGILENKLANHVKVSISKVDQDPILIV